MTTLTKPQAWVMTQIRDRTISSPAWLGELMIRRPGIEASQEFPGKAHYKAQALGRMGGAMAFRLRRKGLIGWDNKVIGGTWVQQPYHLTPEGKDALQKHEKALL